MLVIVTIFIFAIIIYSFKRFGRFITPTSVFCGGFLASCCSAIYFQKKWGFEMNGLTASVIILGILAFLWGASLAKRRFKYATNDSSIELMSFDISNKILIGILLFQIVAYYMQISYIKRYTGIDNIFLASAYYDQLSKYGDTSDFVYPSWTARFLTFSKMFSFFIQYWLARSISFCTSIKKNTKYLLWINFIVSAFACLITGSRGSMIDFVLVFVLMVIFMTKSDIVRRGIPYRKLFLLISIVILGLFLFQNMAVWMGREGARNINATDYIGMYLGAQIPLLNQALQNPFFTKEWGRLTFGALLYPELPSLYNDLFPMGDIHGYPLGNVYTIFASLYYDFGLFGTLLYLFVLSFILQYLYDYYSVYSGKYQNSLFPILFFYFFIEYETLVFAFFSNRTSMIFNNNVLRMIIYMMICIPFLKKIGIKLIKLS